VSVQVVPSSNGRVAVAEVIGQTAAVDWLTVTSKGSHQKIKMFDYAREELENLKRQGNVAKPWKFKGYEGWSCASFRWGTREDSDIAMLSGGEAQRGFLSLLEITDHATRVDLAVTVTLAEPLKDIALEAYVKLLKDIESGAVTTRKCSIVQGNDGGQTLYVGSRISDQLGRLYDKGIESIEREQESIPQGKIWRYEVEFKQERARRVVSQLRKFTPKDKIHEGIGQTVLVWYEVRGITTLMKQADYLPFSTEVSATISDDEKTLRWLSHGVSPAVKRLIARGKGKEVLWALGLEGIDKDDN